MSDTLTGVAAKNLADFEMLYWKFKTNFKFLLHKKSSKYIKKVLII